MSRVVCPNCGQLSASARELSEYHYTESGLDNIWLHGGVTETECSACGRKFVRITREQQLLQVIAKVLLMAARPHSGGEMRFLRRACGLSQAGLASLLKYRRATVAEREAKESPGLTFPEEVGLRLILLQAFLKHVTAPGNSALEGSQLMELFSFSGFFRDFAMKVVTKHRRERINARVQENIWTVEKKGAVERKTA